MDHGEGDSLIHHVGGDCSLNHCEGRCSHEQHSKKSREDYKAELTQYENVPRGVMVRPIQIEDCNSSLLNVSLTPVNHCLFPVSLKSDNCCAPQSNVERFTSPCSSPSMTQNCSLLNSDIVIPVTVSQTELVDQNTTETRVLARCSLSILVCENNRIVPHHLPKEYEPQLVEVISTLSSSSDSFGSGKCVDQSLQNDWDNFDGSTCTPVRPDVKHCKVSHVGHSSSSAIVAPRVTFRFVPLNPQEYGEIHTPPMLLHSPLPHEASTTSNTVLVSSANSCSASLLSNHCDVVKKVTIVLEPHHSVAIASSNNDNTCINGDEGLDHNSDLGSYSSTLLFQAPVQNSGHFPYSSKLVICACLPAVSGGLKTQIVPNCQVFKTSPGQESLPSTSCPQAQIEHKLTKSDCLLKRHFLCMDIPQDDNLKFFSRE